MASAKNKRTDALRARLAQQESSEQHEASANTTQDTHDARAHFLGASVLEGLTQGRAVQQVSVDLIAPELNPKLRQPRLLPLPEELSVDGEWVESERPLIDELLALGASLKERQIQPIVIYPGTSDRYPTANYLIAVGHRRWTAAVLSGLPTIDAIVIEPLSPADLVVIQYAENEDRAEFCDMERAWALERMKEVLGDLPWEEVEDRFHMSEARRKQLMRLTAFTTEQQTLIARLRASETQLRSLHSALRDGSLQPSQAERILQQVSTRAAQQPVQSDPETDMPVPTPTIDRALLDRLVTRARRKAAPAESAPRPRWVNPLIESVHRTRKGLQRSQSRFSELDMETAQDLLNALDQLVTDLSQTTETLLSYVQEQENEPSEADEIPS
jgi:ParB/RepB/Spo0J family partition protein